ncbi:MAG TPA: type II secretion system F family protein [Candidatus Acidoferrales bacterium]|jgi:type II secretory pathway component PulF|nr:type II secretion system F family protein [Candidatus Acidoferrales bacterium]
MTFTPGQLNRRAELYHQLGSMITAGVPLIHALETAATNASLRASEKTITALIAHLQNGLTFSDSMARVHGWMPEFDKALLSAGEQSGRLDSSFKLLANYYATRASIIRDTISRFITTGATVHVFLLIFPLGLFIKCAMGIINNNYSQCVPFIVEKIKAFGTLYGTGIFLIFASQGQRGERWRALIESLMQMVPLLRTAQKYLALSRLAAALEALISSGVSIVKGWPMAAAASGSPHLKRQVSTWDAELEQGRTPAELVSRTRYFPEMFKNLYHSGEISGKLDETLGRLQAYYTEEGFRTLALFTKILTGTIYGLVVILVTYSIITNYAQMFSGAVNPGF